MHSPRSDEITYDDLAEIAIEQAIGQMVIVVFAYGIYCLLTAQAYYVLFTSRRPGYWWHVGFTSVLFSFSTSCAVMIIVINLWTLRNVAYGAPEPALDHLGYVGGVLAIVNQSVADVVLIYRCYCIWNRRIIIVVLPSLLLVAGTIVGILTGEKQSLGVYYSISLFTNVVINALAAGRIWLISRKCNSLVGVKINRRSNRALSILLETGIPYSLALIVGIFVTFKCRSLVGTDADLNWYRWTLARVIWAAFLSILAGIIPTIVIVRVGLGVSTDNTVTVVPDANMRLKKTSDRSSGHEGWRIKSGEVLDISRTDAGKSSEAPV